MKNSVMAFVLWALFASPGFALSCLPPDLINSYLKALESQTPHVVLKGRFVAGANWPEAQQNPTRKTESFWADFTGSYLSKEGFKYSYNAPVRLTFQCDDWGCGQVAADTEVVAFAQKTDQGLELSLASCMTNLASFNISPDDIGVLVQCHQSGRCPKAVMVNDWIVRQEDFLLLTQRLAQEKNISPAPILRRLKTKDVKKRLAIFEEILGDHYRLVYSNPMEDPRGYEE